MNCENTSELLESLRIGTLDHEESRKFRGHLISCRRCASLLNASDWVDLLPALDEEIEPSGDFPARFRARLRARHPQASGAGLRAPWWKVISAWGRPGRLAALGVVAALAAVGVFLSRYPGGEQERAAAYEDFGAAEHLPFFEDMSVISNLELLEDFDTIENLPPVKE
jgi:anti-sigma-K factor RskA